MNFRIKNLRLALLSLTAISLGAYYINPYHPPDWYKIEWEKMRDCSGKNYPPKNPIYLKITGENFFCGLPNSPCRGSYTLDKFIVISEENINNRNIVRHEMLHALGLNHGKDFDRCALAD